MLLMDVSDEESVKKAATKLSDETGRLDVLINNAAIMLPGDEKLLQQNGKLLLETINTNCYGPVRVCRAFLPLMGSPGRIINISSGGGSMTDAVGGWSPAYCVSKSMLNAITRQMAFELAERKIAVNAVCPGWVRTDMGGAGAPRPVEKGAETPVWLASEATQNLTGKFVRDKKVIEW